MSIMLTKNSTLRVLFLVSQLGNASQIPSVPVITDRNTGEHSLVLLRGLSRYACSNIVDKTDLASANRLLVFAGITLPRKEVIHPHLPVRIPCYDLTPITPPP